MAAVHPIRDNAVVRRLKTSNVEGLAIVFLSRDDADKENRISFSFLKLSSSLRPSRSAASILVVLCLSHVATRKSAVSKTGQNPD
nr:hypothetical protein Iba_chr13fCG9560 [Ipomoea batatas]